jgi:hypothetical protein
VVKPPALAVFVDDRIKDEFHNEHRMLAERYT